MRKCLILLLICLLPLAYVSAQTSNSDVNEIFLLKDFENGVVNFKSGHSTKAKLNYGTIGQRMYFMDNESSVLVLTNTEDISTVNIAGRLFEHSKNGQFYEKIPIGDSYMYIDWKIKVITAKIGAYGTKDNTSAIANLSSFGSDYGRIYIFEIPEKIKTISSNSYLIKVNGKFKKFYSFKELAKILKLEKGVMDSYIKQENLDFKNIEDIKKGVEFAMSPNLEK